MPLTCIPFPLSSECHCGCCAVCFGTAVSRTRVAPIWNGHSCPWYGCNPRPCGMQHGLISATVLSIVFVSHCVPTFKIIYRRDLMCPVWFVPHAMSAWRRITGMDTRCSATHIIPIQYRTRPSSEPPNWVRAHPPYIMFALNVAFFVGVFLLGRCKWELLDECINLRALMLRFDLE